jgi:hypothetical protein
VALALRNSSTSGTATVNKPSGTADNDILVMVVGLDAGTANGAANPAGWTQVRDDNDGGGVTLGMRILRKVASGEGASWSFTGSGSDIVIWVGAYTGGDTATPTDGSNGGPTATGTTITAPTVTPTLADDLLICAYCTDGAGAAATNITAMNGTLTARTAANGVASSGGLVRIAVGEKQLASAAATGALTATAAASQANVGSQTLLRAAQGPAGISQASRTWAFPHPPVRVA